MHVSRAPSAVLVLLRSIWFFAQNSSLFINIMKAASDTMSGQKKKSGDAKRDSTSQDLDDLYSLSVFGDAFLSQLDDAPEVGDDITAATLVGKGKKGKKVVAGAQPSVDGDHRRRDAPSTLQPSKKRKRDLEAIGTHPPKKITFMRHGATEATSPAVSMDTVAAIPPPIVPVSKHPSKRSLEEDAVDEQPRKRQPIVVEYKRNVPRKGAENVSSELLKKQRRLFMSEKIEKVHSDALAALLETPSRRTDDDSSDDMKGIDLDKIAREVQVLGATGLGKKEAKELKIRRILALGGAAPEKPRAPFKISLGMNKKQKERDTKRVEQEKMTGLLVGKLSISPAAQSASAATASAKGARWVPQADGLKPGVGKFRKGMLVLSKDEVKTLSKPPPKIKGASRGKKRGGSAGGDGGEKKPKFDAKRASAGGQGRGKSPKGRSKAKGKSGKGKGKGKR